ncbi:MAG: glutamate 5-kinase [Spirochaetia bacterium]|nr:glutamate 5-kinase [Spirochaetia bacterium]
MTYSAAEKDLKEALKKIRFLVIKIGTNIIRKHIENKNNSFFEELAKICAKLIKEQIHPIIVSSGAVGLGKDLMKESGMKSNTNFKNISISEKQAFASLGQSLLIDIYRDAFGKNGIPAAQILVSKEDFQNKKHYQNLKRTLDTLIQWNSIPVINENDAVATDELKVGDNDTLSELITGMYPDTLLIMLTSIDGFYMNNQKVSMLSEIASEELKNALGPKDGGIGGMRTKLKSAAKIMLSGQIMNICSGDNADIVEKIISGEEIGTWFFNSASRNSLSAKKRWILHNRHLTGSIYIDEGAKDALIKSSASLLIVGVQHFEGDFEKGDIVNIYCNEKRVAKGIASMSGKELLLKKEKPSKGAEIIHRDNLIIMN